MARTRALALAAALVPALLAAPAAFGQPAPADVSGAWELQTSVFLGQVPVPEGSEGLPDCEYQGSAQVTQDGGDLGGTSSLMLVGGQAECPAEMSADIDGQVVGTELQMGMLMGGQLGTAQWGGAVGPQLEGQGGGAGGDFTVDSGPFTGAVGTWSAVRGEPSALVIPTLTTVGVVVLVVLLLGAAALLLRRGGAATA